MRLKVPITGTVVNYDPAAAQYDGLGVTGESNDPVRLIMELPNCSWRLVSLDLKNDLAELEVTPSQAVAELKDGGVPDNHRDWESRPATEEEKQKFLDDAKELIESHTIDELYTLAKATRLVKPAGTVELWLENPPNVAAREQRLSQG